MSSYPSLHLAPSISLDEFLSVSKQDYDKCIDVIDHKETIDGINAVTRLHHLKFDGNGNPMVKQLADYLYRKIIHYCLSAKNRPSPLTEEQSAIFIKEARKLFVHPAATEEDPDQTGEAGEMLLYFLTEAVLCAPQVVAKMDLKTNPNLEINGSDGIHMRWNEQDGLVDLFFGESKLYQDIGKAIKAALGSITAFHKKDILQHEYKMVTKHFKYARPEIQKAVSDLMDSGVPGTAVRVNHACLVGYNWTEYGKLPALAQIELTETFRQRYSDDTPRIHRLLQEHFSEFTEKHLRFEVFFMPFPTVQSFRDAFNEALD